MRMLVRNGNRIVLAIVHGTNQLRRTTEGFYDTALNEANDAWATKDSTTRWRLEQTTTVRRRPSVKPMLAVAMNRYFGIQPSRPARTAHDCGGSSLAESVTFSVDHAD